MEKELGRTFPSSLLSSYTNRIYSLVFITAIISLLALFIFRVMLIFSGNGEIGGIDNNFVYGVTRGLAGLDLYSNPAEYPYAITLYPPLYYNICIGAGKLLHINPDQPLQVYQLCRSISLLFDLATCYILYLTLKKNFGINRHLALITLASFATLLCYLGYTFSRADSVLLAFYAGFTYQLTHPWLLKKKYHLLALALLSVLCIFSKQNGIIVPILAVTWIFTQGERKQLFLYLVFFSGIFLATLMTYLFLCNYSYLFSNTIRSLQNRIDFSWFYTDIFKRLMNSLWILPLYGALILSFFGTGSLTGKRDKGLCYVFIIQFAFSLASSLKWGSSAGYFNESFLLSCIIICLTLNRKATDYLKKIYAALVPLFILFLIHMLLQGYLFFIQNRPQKIAEYHKQVELRNYLQPQLKGKFVLNLGNQNGDFFKTLFFREMAVPNFDMVDCCTLPDNTFDYSSLKQDLANGRIGYILALPNTGLKDLWGVPLTSFQRDTTIGDYIVYKYR